MSERGTMRYATVCCLLTVLGVLAALAPARVAQAQAGEPPVLPVVLADLSQRAGRAVTPADFDDWRWSQRTFDDTSLDCPLPGENYKARAQSGYRIIIRYGGATYDYRVSGDGTLLILCTPGDLSPSPAPGTRIPAPLATVAPPTATPPGRVVCPDAMPTYLAIGRSARLADRAAGQLRAAPGSSSTILGLLEPGEPLSIVGGPECADGQVWWQINSQRQVGWTAEGQNEAYWLEPLDPASPAAPSPSPTPAPAQPAEIDLPRGRQRITLQNALRLAPFLARPIEQAAQSLAWSADGRTLAVAGEPGIWLFNAENFSAPPRLLRVSASPANAVAFSPVENSAPMASAHDDGTVRLWDVATGGQLAVLAEHRAPVRALAFSPDGKRLASGEGAAENASAAILLWDLAAGSPVGRLEGHTGNVRALAFSPDGTLLASGADDGAVRLWDLVTVSPVAVLEGHTAPVLDLAFSPDAAWIASAGEDGAVRLWDSAAGGGIVLGQGDAPVRALAFAPSGGLLVSGGDSPEGAITLTLWDVPRQERLGQVALTETGGGAIRDLWFADGGAALALLTTDPPGSAVHVWGIAGAN